MRTARACQQAARRDGLAETHVERVPDPLFARFAGGRHFLWFLRAQTWLARRYAYALLHFRCAVLAGQSGLVDEHLAPRPTCLPTTAWAAEFVEPPPHLSCSLVVFFRREADPLIPARRVA